MLWRAGAGKAFWPAATALLLGLSPRPVGATVAIITFQVQEASPPLYSASVLTLEDAGPVTVSLGGKTVGAHQMQATGVYTWWATPPLQVAVGAPVTASTPAGEGGSPPWCRPLPPPWPRWQPRPRLMPPSSRLFPDRWPCHTCCLAPVPAGARSQPRCCRAPARGLPAPCRLSTMPLPPCCPRLSRFLCHRAFSLAKTPCIRHRRLPKNRQHHPHLRRAPLAPALLQLQPPPWVQAQGLPPPWAQRAPSRVCC